MPLNNGSFGAISVKTAGGASASYSVSLSGITATALSGTPADADEASANPGQAITLNGTGLSTASGRAAALRRYRRQRCKMVQLSPIDAAADGTSATLIVPDATPMARSSLQVLGSASQPLLQIVPRCSRLRREDGSREPVRLRASSKAQATIVLAGANVADTVVNAVGRHLVYYDSTRGVHAHNGSGHLHRSHAAALRAGQRHRHHGGGTSAALALN